MNKDYLFFLYRFIFKNMITLFKKKKKKKIFILRKKYEIK